MHQMSSALDFQASRYVLEATIMHPIFRLAGLCMQIRKFDKSMMDGVFAIENQSEAVEGDARRVLLRPKKRENSRMAYLQEL